MSSMDYFIQSSMGLISYLERCYFNMKRQNPKVTLFGIILILFWLLKKVKKITRRPVSVKNRVALITGGVSGIGRLTALLLKLKGAKVIVWDINDVGIREMNELVDASMKVDITSTIQVESAAKCILDKFGHVDILINNAGIVNAKPMLQLNKKRIELNFAVNVLSHFWTAQAFLPKMIERKSGHIITISSCAAVQGVPRLVDYSASKAACRSFHDSLSLELREQGFNEGICLTCINPYFIKTQMFDGTVTTKWWIIKKLGFDFLKPQYVASQIIRAIEYRIDDEIFLPHIMKIAWLARYIIMPNSLYYWILLNSGVHIEAH